MKKPKIFSVLFVALLLTAMFSMLFIVKQPAQAKAATNKCIRLKKVVFKKMSTQNRFHGAEVSVEQKKKDKLKKSGMKMSAVVYIPKKALKKDKDEILIYPYLMLCDPAADDKKQAVGNLYCKYDVSLVYKKNKAVLYKVIDATAKKTKIGKLATLKEKGSYYIITIKNVPLTGLFLDAKDEVTNIPVGKAFILNPGVTVFSKTAKAWKGNLYIDNLKLKTAAKTQKNTFDKKDYKSISANNWANGRLKPAIVKPMK